MSPPQRLNWAEKEPVIFFPLFEPILFVVLSNFKFWWATFCTFYVIFKWPPKLARVSSNGLKMSRQPLFFILTSFYSMCHTMHFLCYFEMSPQNCSSELQWAEYEQVIFFPLFDPILFIVQSNYQFWCATLYTFNEFLNWALKLLN